MNASRSPEQIALSSAGMRLGWQLFTHESEIKIHATTKKSVTIRPKNWDKSQEVGEGTKCFFGPAVRCFSFIRL